MRLTPADVHNVAFSKPPIGKRGYNEDEVDQFLDFVEAELARLIEENTDLKQRVEELESELAEFYGREAALVFATGYVANMSAIAGYLGRRDFAVVDKEIHNSLLTGVKLAGATMKRFRHNDLEHLEKVLSGLPSEAGKGVIIERRGTKAGHQYQLLGHSISGDIVVEPYLITLTEEAKPYTLFQHAGVEFIYMLTGRVLYRHADKAYPLSPGDALFFDAAAPHGPEELTKLPMTYLSIIIYPRS